MTNINNKIEIVSYSDLIKVEGDYCFVKRRFRVIYFDKHVLPYPVAFFLKIKFDNSRIMDVTPPFSILRLPYSLN